MCSVQARLILDIVSEGLLPKSRSMVATLCPAFIRAIAICMATVDLPDPPFSLATTITLADGDGFVPSADMSALQNVVDQTQTTIDFLVRAISPDLPNSCQPKMLSVAHLKVPQIGWC